MKIYRRFGNLLPLFLFFISTTIFAKNTTDCLNTLKGIDATFGKMVKVTNDIFVFKAYSIYSEFRPKPLAVYTDSAELTKIAMITGKSSDAVYSIYSEFRKKPLAVYTDSAELTKIAMITGKSSDAVYSIYSEFRKKPLAVYTDSAELTKIAMITGKSSDVVYSIYSEFRKKPLAVYTDSAELTKIIAQSQLIKDKREFYNIVLDKVFIRED